MEWQGRLTCLDNPQSPLKARIQATKLFRKNRIFRSLLDSIQKKD